MAPPGRLYVHNGQALTAPQWAAQLGYGLSTLYKRLAHLPLAQALTPPTARIMRSGLPHGELSRLAEEACMAPGLLYNRLARQMPLEQALTQPKLPRRDRYVLDEDFDCAWHGQEDWFSGGLTAYGQRMLRRR